MWISKVEHNGHGELLPRRPVCAQTTDTYDDRPLENEYDVQPKHLGALNLDMRARLRPNQYPPHTKPLVLEADNGGIKKDMVNGA